MFFNNEDIVALRTPAWKMVTHGYYTTSLGAFEKFDQLPGFAGPYEMLFDAAHLNEEAYSYADSQPDALARLRSHLYDARRHFEGLRTRPAAATYPR